MNVPIRRLLRNMRWPVCLAWLACQALAFATPMVSNLPFDMGWNGADAQVQAVPQAAPGKTPAPSSPARSPAPVTVAKPVPPKATAAATADSSPATGVLSVGPGDLLQVTVFGQPDMSAEVSVTDGGEVTLPLIGLIRIAGMAPSEVEKLIAQRLREREYLLKPEVSVTVRQNRSQAVSVLGEVVRPGRYPTQGRFGGGAAAQRGGCFGGTGSAHPDPTGSRGQPGSQPPGHASEPRRHGLCRATEIFLHPWRGATSWQLSHGAGPGRDACLVHQWWGDRAGVHGPDQYSPQIGRRWRTGFFASSDRLDHGR